MSFLLNPYILSNVGTGYLESGTATVSGVGGKEFTGTGALISAAAAVSGAGNIVDAGRLFAEAAAIASSGVITHTGTGALASSVATIEANDLILPDMITGLTLWLDSDDISTLYQDYGKTTPVTADGDPVGCWADKSGNGYDFLQSGTSDQPTYKTGIINSKPVVSSDGTEFMTEATSTNWTFIHNGSGSSVIIVYKGELNSEAFDSLFGNGGNQTAGPGFLYRIYDTFGANDRFLVSIKNDAEASLGITTADDEFVSGNVTIVQVDYEYDIAGNDCELFNNGALIDVAESIAVPSSSAPKHALQLFCDGSAPAGSIVTADIAEVIIYNNIISSSDRADLIAPLKTKWGVT